MDRSSTKERNSSGDKSNLPSRRRRQTLTMMMTKIVSEQWLLALLGAEKCVCVSVCGLHWTPTRRSLVQLQLQLQLQLQKDTPLIGGNRRSGGYQASSINVICRPSLLSCLATHRASNCHLLSLLCTRKRGVSQCRRRNHETTTATAAVIISLALSLCIVLSVGIFVALQSCSKPMSIPSEQSSVCRSHAPT